MEVVMLEFLFPVAHRKYATAVTATWLIAFADWLVEAGYRRQSARVHVRQLREALEGTAPVVSADAVFSVAGLDSMFADVTVRRPNRVAFLLGTKRAFLRFLAERRPGQLIVERERGPHEALLAGYRSYLLDVRGLAPVTTSQHLATTTAFLAAAVPAEAALCDLSRTAVEDFVVAAGRRIKRSSLQHTVAQVRAFLRYCFDHGVIPERLDQIDTPRTYRDELPPRALPWPLVQGLLSSIDRRSKGGYRDHAMLHLMAHYGLRPSEVVALSVNAIDRAAGTLRVEQRKTRSLLILPVTLETLELLDEYLERGRPQGRGSALFLRLRSPAGPLQHYAICDVYQKRARESGLPLAGTSAYALRHGFALRLLESGVKVKTIGDLLGHRSLEATNVYLRLQTETLRHVALAVPPEPTSGAGVGA